MMILPSILLELFRLHGIESTLNGDWVAFPNYPLRATAAIVKETMHPRTLSVQLDVRVELSPGRMLIESFAGIGSNRDEAVADAVTNFTRCTFHVLLAAFFNQLDDGQVLQEEWIIGNRRTRVAIGNFGMRGKADAGQELGNCFKQIEAKVKASTLQQGTHWIRVFYAQMQGKPTICEALLDNDTWKPMEAELSGLGWPARDEFYSARLFLIADVLEGGIAAPEAAVQKLAEIIALSSQIDEDKVYAAMSTAGIPDALADRAYKFTQTAWGRVILGSLVRLDPTYIAFNAAGAVIESGNLTDDPCFAAATRIAPQYAGCAGFKQFTLMSAEVNTVNSALNNGSKPINLVLSPAALFLEPPTDAGLKKASEFLRVHLSTKRQPVDPVLPVRQPAPPKRPSWKPFG